MHVFPLFFVFFFNDTATTEIYTLSLHDALPISIRTCSMVFEEAEYSEASYARAVARAVRSEEHTSELQSQSNLVCRLLLEKKKKKNTQQKHKLQKGSTASLSTDESPEHRVIAAC